MDSVTIFRIKDDTTDPDDIIVARGELWSHPVRIHGALLGMLYVRPTVLKPPSWIGYFDGYVDFSEVRIQTGSVAAVLLIPRGDRLYAVTFGHGRWLLYEGVVESRFGLRVTLNAIEPSQIRSIDHKRLEAVSRHTREQLSRSGGLEHFGLDVERDLLRAVTGTPVDNELGKRLAGADQLTAIGDIPLVRLGDQIDRYAELAARDSYRHNFPWVDNIAEVVDSELRAQLDRELVHRLQAKEWNAIWMAPPEILDWSEVGGFSYRTSSEAEVFDDLQLGDYFIERRSHEELTVRMLSSDRVWCISAVDGSPRQSWSLHRCLVAEVEFETRTYILNEGKWYQIDRDFLTGVDDAISALASMDRQLPAFSDRSEQAYNRRVAEESRGYYALMDRKLVQSGRRGSIEVCDLFGSDRELVHVKRYDGSSALSHLFSQGVVSAEMLLSERVFRVAFNEQLPNSHRLVDPAAAVTPADFQVAYAIVARPGKQLELPFFSKVNLRNAAHLLWQWGYRVTLTPISSAE